MIGLLRTVKSDIRPLAVVILTLTAITLSIVSASASEDWNPKPNSDDVILPLPCGQSMVFRRIITHNAVQGAPTEILEDRRIRLGSPDIDKAYLDYLRSGFIAGHFRSEGKRFYLLGKYETTRAQFKSLMSSGECSVNDGDTFTPVGRLSWHDVSAFSRLLTQHLLKEARTELNLAAGTTRVHARAPTEAEWEFAARGGIAVSIAEFQNPRFPMQHDLRAYAWLNDPLTARNEMAPIGAVLPNPLGLYDMYGNAAEIMVEPFRLNKAGRSHGLAGGVILKGGSFQTNPTFVNSSAREEIALFDANTGEERRQRTNGLRVALVGLALPDGYAVETLTREWRQASESTISQEQDPLLLISELRDSQLDLQLKNNLDTIEQVIREGISAGTDDRSQLLNGLLVGLGKTFFDIRTLYGDVSNQRKLLTQENRKLLTARDIEKIQFDIRKLEDDIHDLNYFGYELLVRVMNSFDFEHVEVEARKVAGELRERGLMEIADSVILTSRMVGAFSDGTIELSRRGVLRLAITY